MKLSWKWKENSYAHGVLLFYYQFMTAITIDVTTQLWKTHFATIAEAVVYLSQFSGNDLEDYDWTTVSAKNKRAYMRSKLWMEETFTLDQAKKLILWDSK
jgi:hypothetical protein